MLALFLMEILRNVRSEGAKPSHASPPHRHLALIGIALAVLIVCAFALSPDFGLLRRQQLEGTMRAKYDRLIAEYDIPDNAEIILVTRKEDRGYLIFLTHYLLQPQELIMQTEDELSLEGLSYIDYIIVFDESDKTNAFIQELSPGYTEPVYHLY